MPTDLDEDRREFLRQATLLLAGISGARALSGCEPASGKADAQSALDAASAAPAAPASYAFLPAQRRTFEAACCRILPSDQDPGAKEANAIEYIDRELARPEYERLKKAMLAGITALDRYADKLGGGKSFIDLAAAEQDDIIGQIQRASDRGRDFVKFLVLLTIEGFVSDPMYGGNKGGVGWRFIGYAPGNPDGSGHGAHGDHH
jgi:gluconate 2-dehydrogenase gamma chain